MNSPAPLPVSLAWCYPEDGSPVERITTRPDGGNPLMMSEPVMATNYHHPIIIGHTDALSRCCCCCCCCCYRGVD
ncbi:hypothetical protein RRG08_001583 [Elysia crispata]|uniref:Uncharacterized protein n=1 Tax=Elysia crispata TaxID=231223 RepID=A0AAE1AM01_9GAST|nr:hypothetical protein RRG08_001583 [Elysia crispata]